MSLLSPSSSLSRTLSGSCSISRRPNRRHHHQNHPSKSPSSSTRCTPSTAMALPSASASGLTKTTHVFTTHQIPLECDVYASETYPTDSAVLLFFHSGGLVGGSRWRVPPWLVQTCYQRQWPLVSASYRLIPQVDAKELVDDARAAYSFARNLGGGSGALQQREVVVVGASAGFSLAAIVARHVKPAPLALLSITGISTFQHPFFSSSVLLTTEPITDSQARPHITSRTVEVGTTVDDAVFSLDKLVFPSGAKNPTYQYKPPPPTDPIMVESAARATADDTQQRNGGIPRGDLYEYYVHRNMFPAMLREVDEGYEWCKGKTHEAMRASGWPPTVFIQGDADPAVDMDVSVSAAKALGDKVAKIFIVPGHGHLFEARSFLEDEGVGMDTVRLAVAALDEAVEASRSSR